MKELKKIMLQCTVILFIFLTLFLLLNIAYKNAVIEKTAASRKYDMLHNYLANRSEIKYAFFGSSHIENSVNPEYIYGSYNLAGRAMTYIENYYELKSLLRKNVKIKYAFFELDMHTFSSYQFNFERPILTNIWHYSKIANLSEISRVTGEPYSKLWIDLHFPVVGNGENFFSKKTYSDIYMGYSRREGNFTIEEIDELAKRRVERQFKNREIITKQHFEYFLKTIKLADENNITVIFIKNPVFRKYDDELSKIVSREKYYKTLFNSVNGTIEEYHILDYYDLFFDNISYFSDADHLNHEGATAYSKKLSDDIGTKFK